MKRIFLAFATLMVAVSSMAASAPRRAGAPGANDVAERHGFLPRADQHSVSAHHHESHQSAADMSRLNLSTTGPGGYRLHTGDAIVKTVVPANGSTTVNLSAWAYAHGGFIRSTEPVEIHGQLWLAPPKGKDVREAVLPIHTSDVNRR